jgi:hypothetical protein
MSEQQETTITPEEIISARTATIAYFQSTGDYNYMRDGHPGDTTGFRRWMRISGAFGSYSTGSHDEPIYDLDQALSHIEGQFPHIRLRHFRQAVFEVWAAKTLCSLAHELAEHMESELKGPRKERKGTKYRSIYDMSEKAPRNMGNFSPLLAKVKDTAWVLSIHPDNVADEDYAWVPAGLRAYHWKDCKFSASKSYILGKRQRGGTSFDDQSIWEMSQTDLNHLTELLSKFSQTPSFRDLASNSTLYSVASNSTNDTASKTSSVPLQFQ